WSIVMAVAGFAASFTVLLFARLALGIGECVFLPSASRIVVRLFPAERRGLPNALVDVGTKIGPGLSTLLGGLMIGRYGWRALFIGVGLASLLWLLPWVYSVPNDSVRQEQQQAGGPGMLEILSRRETWGTSLGMFALGYVWIFLLTWLPSYLVMERGYSMDRKSVV